MPQSLSTRFGSFAEKAVEKWLIGEGFNIFPDALNNSEIDIIAELNGHLIPLQVKASASKRTEDSVRFRVARGRGSKVGYDIDVIFVFFFMDENGEEYVACDIPDTQSYTLGLGDNTRNNIEDVLLTKERLFKLKEKLDNC